MPHAQQTSLPAATTPRPTLGAAVVVFFLLSIPVYLGLTAVEAAIAPAPAVPTKPVMIERPFVPMAPKVTTKRLAAAPLSELDQRVAFLSCAQFDRGGQSACVDHKPCLAQGCIVETRAIFRNQPLGFFAGPGEP